MSTLARVQAAAEWLDPDQLRGRKASEAAIWLEGVRERGAARATGRPVDLERMAGLVAALRDARRYRSPSAPIAVSRRNPPDRDEALAILRRWASNEPGRLSCQRYMAARTASGPTWPTRNTLTRWFGSWEAALAAAGLAERVATTTEVRDARSTAGAEARAVHAQKQRMRVLASVGLCRCVIGRVPAAMEFFRWRLIGAPATPAQASVYKLFPGGWPSVMKAFQEDYVPAAVGPGYLPARFSPAGAC